MTGTNKKLKPPFFVFRGVMRDRVEFRDELARMRSDRSKVSVPVGMEGHTREGQLVGAFAGIHESGAYRQEEYLFTLEGPVITKFGGVAAIDDARNEMPES